MSRSYAMDDASVLVVIGSGAGEPQTLVEALCERTDLMDTDSESETTEITCTFDCVGGNQCDDPTDTLHDDLTCNGDRVCCEHAA